MTNKFNLEAERKYSLSELPTSYKISSSSQVDFLMRACTGKVDWPYLLNDKQILEVGAGECSFLPRFLEFSRPSRFVASDIFLERMGIAKQNINNPSVEFLEANILSLPFNNNEFDLLLAFGILHHIPNIKDAISEIARVLRLGGKFVFRDPYVGNPAIYLKYRFGHRSENEFPIGRRQIRNACKANGLKLIHTNRFWFRFPWVPPGPWSVNIGGMVVKEST